MNIQTGPNLSGSLWTRFMGWLRHPWILLGFSVLLVAAPLVAAYLDGQVKDLFRDGTWRLILSPSVVIIYILVVTPFVERADAAVLNAFRPLLLIDDKEFDRLVFGASRLNPLGEVIAVTLGTVFGLWMGRMWLLDSEVFWLGVVLVPTGGLMFGLLVWTIYVALAGTRLISALHRQPLQFDIFDPQPFRAIGRQSLVIALVFVGGIVLGMVFGLGEQNVLDWRNWLMYSLLALVPVVVFFLNMRPTHRVLTAEKKRELTAVQAKILLACRTLLARIDAAEETGSLGADITALVAYEERLKATSTWPYDTAMLRTLFFSVVIPGVAALARIIGEMSFD